MTLSNLADIADIVGSFGVIASLIFVAWEIRKSTDQTKMANYGSVVDRYSMVYSQTDDLEFANLVAKGRESYLNLAPGEKIAVGHYLEQVCIANESLLVYAHSTTHESNENLELFRRHIRFHLGFRGAREWFDEFEQLRGFPAPYMRAIHEAIDASAAAAFGTMHCARSE